MKQTPYIVGLGLLGVILVFMLGVFNNEENDSVEDRYFETRESKSVYVKQSKPTDEKIASTVAKIKEIGEKIDYLLGDGGSLKSKNSNNETIYLISGDITTEDSTGKLEKYAKEYWFNAVMEFSEDGTKSYNWAKSSQQAKFWNRVKTNWSENTSHNSKGLLTMNKSLVKGLPKEFEGIDIYFGALGNFFAPLNRMTGTVRPGDIFIFTFKDKRENDKLVHFGIILGDVKANAHTNGPQQLKEFQDHNKFFRCYPAHGPDKMFAGNWYQSDTKDFAKQTASLPVMLEIFGNSKNISNTFGDYRNYNGGRTKSEDRNYIEYVTYIGSMDLDSGEFVKAGEVVK